MSTKTTDLWSSRWVFIMAAAGAAVGLGNIWKFPYIAGQNGGGAFVLVYLMCIVLLGLPVLMSEVLIGRRARLSPGFAVRQLAIEAGAKPMWQLAGWFGLVAGFLVLSFYSVIAGWAFAYVPKMALGEFSGLSAEAIGNIFGQTTSDPTQLITWTTVVVLLTCVVVAAGVRQGLELVLRFMMPGLYLLLVALAIYACWIGATHKALAFLFYPDFSKLTWSGVLIALGHAFFTLSLASGVMITYGSYMPGKSSIAKTSLWIAVADTSVALLAGMVIYPIVMAQGLDAGQGPGLLFVTLPIAFASMPAGIVIGTLFFIMLVFAAFTSTIAMVETVVAWLVQAKNWSRLKATGFTGLFLWLLSMLTVASFANWPQVQFEAYVLGKTVHNWFELIDHLTSDILLPLGGLGIAIFCGHVLQRRITQQELNTTPFVYSIWYIAIRWITPLAILTVFASLLGLLN